MADSLCYWKPSDVPVLKMFYVHSGFDPEKNGGWSAFQKFTADHLQSTRTAIEEAGLVLSRIGVYVDPEPLQGYYELTNKIEPLINVGGFVRVGLHCVSDGDRIAIVTYPHNVAGEFHVDLDDMPDADFMERYGIGKKAVFDAVSDVDGLLLAYLENSRHLVSAKQAYRRAGDNFTSEISRDRISDVEVYLERLYAALRQKIGAPANRQPPQSGSMNHCPDAVRMKG